jgi:hypothetical protein
VAPSVDYGADTAAVDTWLGELGRVHLDFRPPPAAPPAGKLTITTGARADTMDVGVTNGMTVIARAGEPTRARGPSTLVGLLDPDPLRFRDRTLLDLARLDAQRLRVSSGGRAVEVSRRDGAAWTVEAPAGLAADGAAIDRVLVALTNLRAARFVRPTTSFKVETTLDLTEQPPGAPAPLHHVLELGASRSDGCPGRLAGKAPDATFVLAPAVCDDLRAPIAR